MTQIPMTSGLTGWQSAALGIGVAGGVMAAGGQVISGVYQGRLASYNARMLDLQARDARERGLFAIGRHQRDVRGLIGAQRAALAAQGVQVDSGTAAEIQTQTAAQSAEDVGILADNAAREAWGFEQQAAISRWQGKSARVSGAIGGFATLLGTGAGTAANYWQLTR